MYLHVLYLSQKNEVIDKRGKGEEERKRVEEDAMEEKREQQNRRFVLVGTIGLLGMRCAKCGFQFFSSRSKLVKAGQSWIV